MTTNAAADMAETAGTEPEHDPAAGSHGWGVRLLTALVVLPLLFIGLMGYGLSPMALDSCGPDDCEALKRSLGQAQAVGLGAGLAAVVLLVVTWALPSKRKHRDARAVVALLAVAAAILCPAAFNNPVG
ncbi:hypothetical protein GCM10010218_30020 [Streptomyces mashuensis]|uniref:Uncharacterized protein n=1 Tax=Streptomyces mashuensis TaxID=33904 RepID=A0A919B4U0_9ACTN|nr:hypothetical protein [Streptomyces mashuensis]GHF46728.1 hypothetical protein GCM10010218_30020 [Streptomyces mashuensis]